MLFKKLFPKYDREEDYKDKYYELKREYDSLNNSLAYTRVQYLISEGWELSGDINDSLKLLNGNYHFNVWVCDIDTLKAKSKYIKAYDLYFARNSYFKTEQECNDHIVKIVNNQKEINEQL